MTKLSSPIKYHGGKHYLAKKIIELMPPHKHYVEPYAGSLAILLKKNPNNVSEVVNDLNPDLINFWRVLQTAYPFFKDCVEKYPVCETFWNECEHYLKITPFTDSDTVERAAKWFVYARQSLAGRLEDFTAISKTRTRRGMNEQASAWLTAIDGLYDVHKRLSQVVILNRPALKIIESQDGPNTLFYLDPPYLQSTRTAKNTYGKYEMTIKDHKELLRTINKIRGRFILSGYTNPYYYQFGRLNDWYSMSFDLPNNAASGKTKSRKQEFIWTNFAI